MLFFKAINAKNCSPNKLFINQFITFKCCVIQLSRLLLGVTVLLCKTLSEPRDLLLVSLSKFTKLNSTAKFA